MAAAAVVAVVEVGGLVEVVEGVDVEEEEEAEEGEVRFSIKNVMHFWGTPNYPSPIPFFFFYSLSLRAKCWGRGGVGGEFPETCNDSKSL